MNETNFNDSKKKAIRNIFTTKSLLIILGVAIVAGVIVYFSFVGRNNKKTLSCNYTYDYGFAFSTTTMHIEYNNDKIKKAYLSILYEITDDIIKDNIDLYEKKLRDSFEKTMSDKLEFNLVREGNSIKVSYIVDFENFNINDITASEYFGLPSEDEYGNISLSELKEEIKKYNGSCK